MGFYSVVVELNYCNNSKRKRKNGGQEERKEGKKRRKGGKGKEERAKKDSGRKSIDTGDESSVGGGVGRFFLQSPGGLPKTRAATRVFGNRGLAKKIRPTEPPTPEPFSLERCSTSTPTQPALIRPKTPSILRVIPLLRPNIPTRPSHTHL
jgi:hypothetical protein